MQHVWLAGLQKGRSVPPAEMEFWLRRVAKDALSAHWRMKLNRPKHIPLPEATLAGRLARQLESEPIAADLLDRTEVRDQILLALTQLSAAEQELIIDRYFRGRTLGQLAERLGISERAVEGRLYRARQAIRNAMTHPEE